MKKNLMRIGILLAALLLAVPFLFPLWKIEIWAPQYPEGLSMQIWINKLTGDVRNINILNHYIGMASIHDEDFKELQYFPTVFAAFTLSGLLVGAIAHRWLTRLWVAALGVFSIVAFYDFYKWEYRFGHELNPDAAIKVEGMSYQPPLIGVKTLLNIEAWSLPGLGGYAMLGAVALAVLVVVYDFIQQRKQATH